jgi:hypothetical protein
VHSVYRFGPGISRFHFLSFRPFLISNEGQAADQQYHGPFYLWPVLFHRKTTTHPFSREPFGGTAEASASTIPSATVASPSPAATSTAGEVSTTPERTSLPGKLRNTVKLKVSVHKSKSDDLELSWRVVFRRPVGDQAFASNGGTFGDRNAGARSETEESS